MKKKTMIPILFIFVLIFCICIACNKQDEDENFYWGLDITDNTPLTRSVPDQMNWENISTSDQSWRNVPVRDNECMLYAMIRMAKDNTMGINFKENGTTKTSVKHIGESFSAEDAYNYALDVASNYKQPQFDNNLQEIEGSEKTSYKGGPMAVSVGLQVGNDLGLLSGNSKEFNSYEELLTFLQSDEWNSKDNQGYITHNKHFLINDNTKSHTVIFESINTKKGIIKFTDYQNSNKEMKDENHSYTIMY